MSSTPGHSHLSEDDLTATVQDDLPLERRWALAAHLNACPECQRRLAERREVGARLRQRFPAVRQPHAWTAFTDRLAEQETRSGARPQGAVATAALVVLLALLIAVQQGQWAAVEGFADYVLRDVAPSDPAVGSLSFVPVEPPLLPLGLVPTQRSMPSRDYLELLYENDSGLAILVGQSPAATTPPPTITVGEAGSSTIYIDDAEILVLNDPRPDTVAAMFWEHKGVRFDVLITERPPYGLPRSDAANIAEALLTAQSNSKLLSNKQKGELNGSQTKPPPIHGRDRRRYRGPRSDVPAIGDGKRRTVLLAPGTGTGVSRPQTGRILV